MMAFVKRYHTTEVDDGLPPGEGTFLACSFWLVDNLALQGRFDEAHRDVRTSASDWQTMSVFLSEEYDTVAKRLVGNFPQAFSHVALVHTGMNLMSHEQEIARATGQPSSQHDRPTEAGATTESQS